MTDRPIGITVIAIVSLFGAFLGALSITLEFAEGVAAGLWNILRTALNGVAGYGLWYLKDWAYPMILFIYSFLLIGNGILFLLFEIGTPGNIFSSVLIFGVMMYYIYTKRELFVEVD